MVITYGVHLCPPRPTLSYVSIDSEEPRIMFYISLQLDGTGRNSLEKNFKTREPPNSRSTDKIRTVTANSWENDWRDLKLFHKSKLFQWHSSIEHYKRLMYPQIEHAWSYILLCQLNTILVFTKTKGPIQYCMRAHTVFSDCMGHTV